MHKQEAIIDQATASAELFKFLYSKSRTKFGLYGRAGTGKTYVGINTILKWYRGQNKKKLSRVAFISISNKAVNVLVNQFNNIINGRPGFRIKENDQPGFMTTTRFLNKKATYDMKGETVFKQNKWVKSQSYDLIVVDEASMLDSKQLNELYSYTKRWKGCKFLFIADKYQCPPPSGESLSKIFEYDHYELTHPYRYDNEIKQVVDFVRESVDNKLRVDRFKKELEQKANSKVIIYDSKREFLDKIVSSFNSKKNITSTCYRNKTTEGLSNCIRNKIVKYPEDQYNPGDILLCTQSNAKLLPNPLVNSELYEVMSVDHSSVSIYKHADIWNYLEVVVDNFNYDIYNKPKKYCDIIPCYLLELRRISNNNTVYAWVIDSRFEEDLENLKSKAYELMKKYNFSNDKLASDYYDLSNLFAKFIPGFSINVYRSQGSTYSEIFVNMKDILNLKPISLENKYRALYTAMTRATDRVHILNTKK